jgi:hypothetical protein
MLAWNSGYTNVTSLCRRSKTTPRTMRCLIDLQKSVYRVPAIINHLSPKLLEGCRKILDKYSGGEKVEIY